MLVGMYPRASRGVSVAAPLHCQPLIPSVPLCPQKLTPYPSLKEKQPLVFPHHFAPPSLLLSKSPRYLVRPFRFRLLCAPQVTWLGMLLGCWVTWVTFVNLLLPSLLLPGALSCSPVHHVYAQSPSPSQWRVVPSTPLDLTGWAAPAVDFQSLYQTPAQGFL